MNQSKYNNQDNIKESGKESPDNNFSVISSITNITKESMDMILSSIDELTEPLFFQSAKRVPKQDPKQDLKHYENDSNFENHGNHIHDYHTSGEDSKHGHYEGHEDHQEGFLKHSGGIHLPSMRNLLSLKKKNYTVYNVLIGSSYIKGVIVIVMVMMDMIIVFDHDCIIIVVLIIIIMMRLAKII